MRKVTISTISVPIRGTGFPSPCLAATSQLIEQAFLDTPDLIVTPEEPDLVGCDPDRLGDVPAPIPGGRNIERYCELARRGRCYIVADLRERDGDRVFNTAVLIDRAGSIVGKYRKTHCTPQELDEIEPGSAYPVFDTDFGRVAMLVCMDIHYPEIWRIMGLRGADVVAWPTQCLDYTGDLIESLVNARAIDNQYYVVASHFVEMPYLAGKSYGRSRIVDPYGRTRADTSHRPGVATATVDLDEVYELWYQGEYRRRFPTLRETNYAMRRPETYALLTAPDRDQLWRLKHPTLHGLPPEDEPTPPET